MIIFAPALFIISLKFLTVWGGGRVQYVISWLPPDIIKYINFCKGNSQIQHKERDMNAGNMRILLIDKSNGNKSSHEKIR
jgi:hypothetical protein